MWFFWRKKNIEYNVKIITPNENIKFTSEEIENAKELLIYLFQMKDLILYQKYNRYAISRQFFKLHLKTSIGNKIENKKEIKIY